MTEQTKKVCRLCYYETVDTVDIFSEAGTEFDYEGKITKYLYLSVSLTDDLPKTVCWMCRQNLETFHRFYEKINEIQKSTLKTEYDKIALQPKFYEAKINNSKPKETVVDDYGNLYEIIIDPDDNESQKPDADDENEIEEYELFEVDVCDSIENDKKSNAIDALPIVIGKEESTSYAVLSKATKKIPETRRSSRLKQIVKKSRKIDEHRKIKRKSINSTKSVTNDSLQHDDEIQEGDSDDEFPARNSDDESWPSQMTLNEFPKEIIRNGLLLIKGKQLMSMICRFYNLECKHCKKRNRFKTLNELFDHYLNIHKEEGHIECCQTKLSRYPAIIMHMARHLQPDAFKCDECGYIVTRPRFLQSHKQTHLPEDQKPYACNECSRRFCWKSALRIHLISHQPADERKQYICPICERSYDTPGGLSTHKKLIHSEQKPVRSNICHLCAKNFATRTGLQEHMLSIHQPREKGQVQCNECGKWLMNMRCLKTHQILHSNIELSCDQCDYTTKKKVLLNRHLVTQHSTEKPFVCNLCGRAFKMKRALTVHLAQHDSTTVYKCPFCDRKFNSSTNYYTHRKNAHPKELAEMKQKEEETRRRKRIEAGIEEDSCANEIQATGEHDQHQVIVLQVNETGN